MEKKISELPDLSSSLSYDDVLVVVDSETNVTGRATVDSVVGSGLPIYTKIVSSTSTRGYLVENIPTDNNLSFDCISDNIDEGVYEVKLNAFFSGSPPVAFMNYGSAGVYGFQKISKINCECACESCETSCVTSFTGVSLLVGYMVVIDEISSLLVPGSSEYEPMFFYENDPSLSQIANGYFVEIHLFANINPGSPLNFKWCSIVDGEQTILNSADLQITKLKIL